MIRARLFVTAAAVALTSILLPTGTAQASGWVANSCAVKQALHATMVEKPGDGMNGHHVEFVPCGTGISGVDWVHAGRHPYYVDPQGPQAPWCMQAGQRFHPNDSGFVLTPTIRCGAADRL